MKILAAQRLQANDLVSTYQKIKGWNATALAGYATKVGIDRSIIDPIKRDAEALTDEIMGYLFDEDWMIDLMKKGIL